MAYKALPPHEAVSPEEERERRRYRKIAGRIRRRRMMFFILTGAMFCFLAFLIYLFQPVVIAGDSMQTMIKDGGHCTLNRSAYWFADPRRGEVIIYKQEGKRKISRIAALPGDRVSFGEGRLSVNDRVYEREALPGENADFALTLPDQAYFVLPDQAKEIGPSVNCIQKSQIEGKVWSW